MTVFAPTGTVADDVSQFEVTFSDYIDVASFTAADVPVTQPGGETLPASQITVAAIVTGRPDLVNRFEVALPAQTAEGPGSSAALVRENRPRGRTVISSPTESRARVRFR